LDISLQTSQFYVPPGFIDLGLGDPQFALLPLDLLRRSAEERFAAGDPAFLQYGAKQGDGYFRRSLAEFLGRSYGSPVQAENLFVTAGASMGLHLICSLFTSPGDTIFVEEPTYFFALRIFADHGLNLVPIRTDEQGMDVEDLGQKLAAHRPKFLYIIPTFQNPTGHTLPLARRLRLMDLSKAHNLLVVADEVYHCLNYTDLPPQPLAASINSAPIIAIGSFSKILAPGLRLGWIQAGEDTIDRFVNYGLLDSGGGMNPFTSAMVRGLIESGGLDKNIAKLKDTYRARLQVMDAALRRHLPGFTYTVPRGGYFFWLRLPDGINANELQRRAEAARVGFRAGALFSSQGGMQEYIRLCFVFYEEAEIEEGILRLMKCLKE
jgi:2-aminoadipate transaminase